MPQEDNVGRTSVRYDQMSVKWEMLHDLLGGTFAMRTAGTKWLPQEPKELDPVYNLRLERSFLYEAFANTVDRLVSKPFSRPVTWEGIPDSLENLTTDIDANGSTLTQFVKDLFEKGLIYGMTHVLVDFSKSIPDATIADEKSLGTRPVLVHVTPPNLLGWRTETDLSGQTVLTDVRIREIRTEPEGNFGDKEVEYIRHLTRTDYTLYRKNEQGEYVIVEQGSHTFGRVPLLTYYVERTGFLQADPPLEALCHLNIAHWQSMSDQRNILRFARAGILFASGFQEDELDDIVIGPNSFVETQASEANLRYVEHSGKAIGAGAADIASLEERMEVLGLQPLIERTAKSTATGKVLDEEKTMSSIQAWIRSLEDLIESAITLAAEYMKATLTDLSIDIFNDFGVGSKGVDEIGQLTKMRELTPPQISHETFLNEMRRRNVLLDTLDIEEEIQRVNEEDQQRLDALIGQPEDDEDEDDEVDEVDE